MHRCVGKAERVSVMRSYSHLRLHSRAVPVFSPQGRPHRTRAISGTHRHHLQTCTCHEDALFRLIFSSQSYLISKEPAYLASSRPILYLPSVTKCKFQLSSALSSKWVKRLHEIKIWLDNFFTEYCSLLEIIDPSTSFWDLKILKYFPSQGHCWGLKN